MDDVDEDMDEETGISANEFEFIGLDRLVQEGCD